MIAKIASHDKYSPISRRWQEITWLLPRLSRAKHYMNLSYIGFRVTIAGQGLDNQCSKCLHPTPKLNTTIYICNNNTITAFRKLGDLIYFGACLFTKLHGRWSGHSTATSSGTSSEGYTSRTSGVGCCCSLGSSNSSRVTPSGTPIASRCTR